MGVTESLGIFLRWPTRKKYSETKMGIKTEPVKHQHVIELIDAEEHPKKDLTGTGKEVGRKPEGSYYYIHQGREAETGRSQHHHESQTRVVMCHTTTFGSTTAHLYEGGPIRL